MRPRFDLHADLKTDHGFPARRDARGPDGPSARGQCAARRRLFGAGHRRAALAPAGNRRSLTLLTNGKFQGSDDPKGEMVAQIGFAVAPLLHTPGRSRALVIGYGTGVSSRTLHEAGFAGLDIGGQGIIAATNDPRRAHARNDRHERRDGHDHTAERRFRSPVTIRPKNDRFDFPAHQERHITR